MTTETHDDRGHRLALLMQALEDVEAEYAKEKQDLKEEFGKRLSQLRIEMGRLKHEILTGQRNLLDVVEAVAAEVNAGLLDKDGVKVTADVVNSTERRMSETTATGESVIHPTNSPVA
jgi:hypothetical protein